MQPLPGTCDQEGHRMPTWCTIGHSLNAAALATGLLLAISCPVRAENGLDPQDQKRGSIVPLRLIQLTPRSSIPQRPIHGLPAEHVEAIQRFIGAIDRRHRHAECGTRSGRGGEARLEPAILRDQIHSYFGHRAERPGRHGTLPPIQAEARSPCCRRSNSGDSVLWMGRQPELPLDSTLSRCNRRVDDYVVGDRSVS